MPNPKFPNRECRNSNLNPGLVQEDQSLPPPSLPSQLPPSVEEASIWPACGLGLTGNMGFGFDMQGLEFKVSGLMVFILGFGVVRSGDVRYDSLSAACRGNHFDQSINPCPCQLSFPIRKR